ncbi:MAG: hypothetical protein P8X67_20905 [Syntrophobacterales bacterium]
MQSNVKVRLFATIFALIMLSVCPISSSGKSKPQRVECDVHAGPCRADISGTKVSLDIEPKPVKAMRDLTFTVTFAGGTFVAAPYIDLGMPNMNMGRNRVILKQVGDLVYRGEGVIVRCPSGRRTWKAKVTVPEVGSVKFVFDVIY